MAVLWHQVGAEALGKAARLRIRSVALDEVARYARMVAGAALLLTQLGRKLGTESAVEAARSGVIVLAHNVGAGASRIERSTAVIDTRVER